MTGKAMCDYIDIWTIIHVLKCQTTEESYEYQNIYVRKSGVCPLCSEDGRKEINEELSEPYLSAVMTVWGDTPTVVIDPELRWFLGLKIEKWRLKIWQKE